MVLYHHGMPLSVLGSCFGVHKTTILRRMLCLAIVLWPIVYKWILDNVKAKAVYIDEKWLKIRGKWLYWFVVLDTETGLPVLAALLPSAGKWACRWIGVRKKKMKRVLQTNDKRTARRRLQKLKESSQELGISVWVDQIEEKLVGSACIPSTTNAIERFFRAFNQFYKKRCGFFSVVSTKRDLILFLVMYLFIRQPDSGKAPIESIMPDAREMPLYELINDPLRTAMGVENVNRNVKMADSGLLHCA